MVLRVLTGPDDLAASRFAISPLAELECLLRHLDRVEARTATWPPAVRQRWEDRYAPLRADLGVRALQALRSPRYGVNFVAPPPAGVTQTLDDDLVTVRATPLPLARAEIAHALSHRRSVPDDVAAFLRRDDVVELLARALELVWRTVIGPEWPQLRAIIERDIVHRAEQLTSRGWADAVDGLHPSVRWGGGGLAVRSQPDEEIRLDGRGLLLVPSVFVGPGVICYTETPWRPAILYPARGSAALWRPGPAVPGALERLLGATRAQVLLALDTPASTTQLVAATGGSLGGIGEHLRVLLDAGLVTRSRAGRSVLYRRSPVGDALIAPTVV